MAIGQIQRIVTPSGAVSVVTSIAERLLAEGVMSGTLGGYLHAADPGILKAAVLANGVCDFCSALSATHIHEVADFDMPAGGTSVGGWAACETCDGLIRAGKRRALVERSIEMLAFPKFSRGAIKDLHETFWQCLGLTQDVQRIALRFRQFINDELPDDVRQIAHWQQTLASGMDRSARAACVSEMAGLSEADMADLLNPLPDMELPPAGLLRKLIVWRKRWGGNEAAALNNLSAPHKPVALHQIPHWQQALDAKFAVMQTLDELVHASDRLQSRAEASSSLAESALWATRAKRTREETITLGISHDLSVLRNAQVYSFNGETAAAIQEAAVSIPHDAPLSSIETPNTGAGWFWFGEPLTVAACPSASDKTHGLLWHWAKTSNHGPALVFSVYVRDDRGVETKGKLLPSTRWIWPFEMTFDEMLAFTSAKHAEDVASGAKDMMTTDQMAAAVSEISLFFIMACVWFRQTVPGQAKKADPVLTQEAGHIERHARKRLQREHKLAEPPTVTVVALRKSLRVAADVDPARVEGARAYQCRWIVRGHSRLQACGPGRKDRKLVWIQPHIAGPSDKPMKVSAKTTVFAVVR